MYAQIYVVVISINSILDVSFSIKLTPDLYNFMGRFAFHFLFLLFARNTSNLILSINKNKK